jgi:hypothetical protein
MARITILKADILRTAVNFRTLSASILNAMKADLQQWYTGLPAYMHLDALIENPELPTDQRRVTFYMHLFYLSAIMLKARAVLPQQDLKENYYNDPELRAAVLDGMQAARSSGRLLGLIFDENAVIENCWLLM